MSGSSSDNGGYEADWLSDGRRPHGGTYIVRRKSDGEIVRYFSPYGAGWEDAKALADALNEEAVDGDA